MDENHGLVAESQRVVRLSALPPGSRGVVVEVATGSGAVGRLVALGLAPGRSVRVLRNDGVGPVILAAGATRLALGRGLARDIRLQTGEG